MPLLAGGAQRVFGPLAALMIGSKIREMVLPDVLDRISGYVAEDLFSGHILFTRSDAAVAEDRHPGGEASASTPTRRRHVGDGDVGNMTRKITRPLHDGVAEGSQPVVVPCFHLAEVHLRLDEDRH